MEVASEKVSSVKSSSEDEDDESGEKKDGRSAGMSRRGITRPSSFADAIAPTGSEVANEPDGEDESGRDRDAFLMGSSLGAEVGSGSREELRLAFLIIFLSNAVVDFGDGKAERVVFSAAPRGLATGSISRQLGSRYP